GRRYALHVNGADVVRYVSSPLIFAANHVSELDPLTLGSSLPSSHLPLFFVTLPKQWYQKPRFGWRQHLYGGDFFYVLGGRAVTMGTKDYASALENQQSILESGYNLCMFPEGKMNPKYEGLEARGGVAYLAFVTQTPIVPVQIYVSQTQQKITLRISEPLWPADLFHSQEEIPDYKATAQYIMRCVYSS
ncbi:MAG: hypothetical protein BRC24_01830, partial [Parcubacteria group bacterium SW_4_46_8]